MRPGCQRPAEGVGRLKAGGEKTARPRPWTWKGRLEARVGLEPTNKGFADLSLSRLGTAPRFCMSLRMSDWSGRWDLNPRPSAWQADVLPLNYARSIDFLVKEARPKLTEFPHPVNNSNPVPQAGLRSGTRSPRLGTPSNARHASPPLGRTRGALFKRDKIKARRVGMEKGASRRG